MTAGIAGAGVGAGGATGAGAVAGPVLVVDGAQGAQPVGAVEQDGDLDVRRGDHLHVDLLAGQRGEHALGDAGVRAQVLQRRQRVLELGDAGLGVVVASLVHERVDLAGEPVQKPQLGRDLQLVAGAVGVRRGQRLRPDEHGLVEPHT